MNGITKGTDNQVHYDLLPAWRKSLCYTNHTSFRYLPRPISQLGLQQFMYNVNLINHISRYQWSSINTFMILKGAFVELVQLIALDIISAPLQTANLSRTVQIAITQHSLLEGGVMAWKCFLHYWLSVMGIRRWPVSLLAVLRAGDAELCS